MYKSNLWECPKSIRDTYGNVHYPISMYKTDNTFTVQTYVNVQYPISIYKVDIHCTNLWECPISNIDVQGKHSMYKPI